MKNAISIEIQKRAAFEVVVNKASKSSVAKMLKISERSIGRYVEKFASEVVAKPTSVNVEDIVKQVKSRVVLTKSGKMKSRPSESAIKAFIASNGDKAKFQEALGSKVKEKTMKLEFYRAKAYIG